ncbi:hypothetical protein [Nostoc sp.]|uniref:hypothetical protein n=1 Tax=Nostoc sp. TaxID=1180 RepID=UPI002FFAF9CD
MSTTGYANAKFRFEDSDRSYLNPKFDKGDRYPTKNQMTLATILKLNPSLCTCAPLREIF